MPIWYHFIDHFKFKDLKKYLLILSVVLWKLQLLAQSCQLPILTQFTDRTETSIGINWLDNNTDALSWEIELGTFGFERSFIPTVQGIIEEHYIYNNLSSGTAYEFYIRTVCNNGISDWNGPYFFNTAINNHDNCQLSLPLDDNNCPSENVFFIAVEEPNNPVLGVDTYLEAVNLIIEHPWTPDLSITLMDPSGIEINLLEFKGVHNKDIGSPSDMLCDTVMQFSNLACEELSDFQGPFIGSFIPEESLATFNNSNIVINGNWVLKICDRANGDIGNLIHVELEFNTVQCELPDSIFISNVEGDHVSFSWSDNANCADVKLTYGLLGFMPNEATIDFVECDNNGFTIQNLMPDTEYELFFQSVCADNSFIDFCPIQFKTACGNSTLSSDFDQYPECVANCNRSCIIGDSIWHNDLENEVDWILFSGTTPTNFTGPSGDISGFGKYLYLESQPEACGINYQAILESNCLSFNQSNSCGIDFYYHMWGTDVDSLILEYSLNENENWVELWSIEGNQSDQWFQAQVDLSILQNQSGNLRFRATSNIGSFGDIGLDEIKLFGASLNAELFRYFRDADLDGFGNISEDLIICQNAPPVGFSLFNNDCNDNDDSINPAAQEIPCNLTDENCNGNEDDEQDNDLQFRIITAQNVNCSGFNDGIIEIMALGGIGNYTYLWNTGQTDPNINGLESGVYFCTISDQAGCSIVTEPIFIDSEVILSFAEIRREDPSCNGVDDGLIEIAAGGGVAPFTFSWNNGMNGDLIEGLGEGFYVATISDFFGCEIVTDSILIEPDPEVIPGIQLKRDASCNGSQDGSLLANVTGGQAPYKFLWSTGDSTSFIGDLAAGPYHLTVVDDNDCIGTINNILVGEPDALEIVLDATEAIRCFGENDGQIQITVNGGSPPYSYFWSDNSFDPDRINIQEGSYSLTVTDRKSCSTELQNIVISSNPEIEIQLDSLVNAECEGSNEGALKVLATGGKSPYQYNWSNGVVTNTIENVPAGFYSVTVVDAFECKAIFNNLEVKNLNRPIPIDIEIAQDILCFEDSIAQFIAEIDSPNPPYDFNWSFGSVSQSFEHNDTVSNIPAGIYALTVTDANGCTGVFNNITTSNPEVLQYEATIENSLCFGNNNAQIALEIEGGSPNYEVFWSNSETGPNIDLLQDGTYFATITDRNNCELVSQEFLIQSPDSLEVQASVFGNDGSGFGRITLFVNGGTPPYSYFWDGDFTVPNDSLITNLASGNYQLTLEDANGCRFLESYLIDNLTSINNIENPNIHVYPNPTNGVIHIDVEHFKINKLALVSIDGKQFELPSSKSINLEELNLLSGLYILTIELSNDKTITERIFYQLDH